jgi:hypothetical protein
MHHANPTYASARHSPSISPETWGAKTLGRTHRGAFSRSARRGHDRTSLIQALRNARAWGRGIELRKVRLEQPAL